MTSQGQQAPQWRTYDSFDNACLLVGPRGTLTIVRHTKQTHSQMEVVVEELNSLQAALKAAEQRIVEDAAEIAGYEMELTAAKQECDDWKAAANVGLECSLANGAERDRLQAQLTAAKERAEAAQKALDSGAANAGLLVKIEDLEAEFAQLRPKAALADEVVAFFDKDGKDRDSGFWDDWLARYDALRTPAPATTTEAGT